MILTLAIAAALSTSQSPAEHALLALYRDGGLETTSIEKRALSKGPNSESIHKLVAEGFIVVDAEGWLKVAISPQCPPFDSIFVKSALGAGLALNRPLRWGDIGAATQKALLPSIDRGGLQVSNPDPDTRIMLSAEVAVDFVIDGKTTSDAIALDSQERYDLHASSQVLKAHPLKEDPSRDRPGTKRIELRVDSESEFGPVLPELVALASRTYAAAIDEQTRLADVAVTRVLQALVAANPELESMPERGANGTTLPPAWMERMKDTFMNSASVLGFDARTAESDWKSANSKVRHVSIKVWFAVKQGSGEPIVVSSHLTTLN